VEAAHHPRDCLRGRGRIRRGRRALGACI
jgi:hypothetical protein